MAALTPMRPRLAENFGAQRRLVPFWMLALTLGLAAGVAAAFTGGAPQALSLGAAALLLTLACAGSRYAALTLLVILLTGHVAFTADFAKLSVSLGTVPLYVTEFLMLPVLLGSTLALRWTRETLPLVATLGALAFFAIWLIAEGVLAGRTTALVLRQSVLFIYPLIALGCAWNIDLTRDRGWVARVALAVCALSLIATAVDVALGGHIARTETGLPRYFAGLSGTFFAAVFIGVLITQGRPTVSSQLLLAGTAVILGVGVILSEHRSIFLGTALGVAAAYLVGGASWRSVSRISLTALTLALLAVAAALYLELGEQVVGTLERVADTADTENVNSAWRLEAWKIALADIVDQPLTGVGLGKPLDVVFQGQVTVVEPHNSIVNIAWHSGLPGVAVFAVSQVAYLARVLRRRRELAVAGWSAPVLVGAWVSLLTVAAFNVILESPIGATAFWLVVGLPFGRLTLPKSDA